MQSQEETESYLGQPHLQGRRRLLSPLAGENGSGCSWAPGYFYQATCLKGRVVGRSLGLVQFRWLRRMFAVSSAELRLYDYNQPFHWDNKPPVVAKTSTTRTGDFEFGALKEGHYRLEISSANLDDYFDVEITSRVPLTKNITIDISPISPDCTGGHEFEVETAKK
jgi:hypothetical protein